MPTGMAAGPQSASCPIHGGRTEQRRGLSIWTRRTGRPSSLALPGKRAVPAYRYRLLSAASIPTRRSLSIRLATSTALAGAFLALAALGAAPVMAQDAYWNGPAVAGPGSGFVNGGTGTWNAVNGNWSNAAGTLNNLWSSPFSAIFAMNPGVVTVDKSFGAIGVTGLQFLTSGYLVVGDAITLSLPISATSSRPATRVGASRTAPERSRDLRGPDAEIAPAQQPKPAQPGRFRHVGASSKGG